MEDANIQCNSSSPLGDGLKLPRVVEEMLDTNIWSQTDSSMPEDSVCGPLTPSTDYNQYNFFPTDDDRSGFNTEEQSHSSSSSHLQDAASIPSTFQQRNPIFYMEDEIMEEWNVWGEGA